MIQKSRDKNHRTPSMDMMDLHICRYQTEVILLRRFFRPLKRKHGHFDLFKKTFWTQNIYEQ